MKIRDNYVLSDVAGTPVVVPLGAESTFRNMIKLNETGKFLWELLKEDISHDALVAALVKKYGIDASVASDDLDAFLKSLDAFGALEEE